MRRIAILAALLLATIVAPAALACGVCIDDKVAATYDHATVTRALARHHAVVFAGMESRDAAGRAAALVRAAARRVRGIDAESVRTATEPLALSFVVEADQTPETALAEIQRGAAGVRLTMLKVMR